MYMYNIYAIVNGLGHVRGRSIFRILAPIKKTLKKYEKTEQQGVFLYLIGVGCED